MQMLTFQQQKEQALLLFRRGTWTHLGYGLPLWLTTPYTTRWL